MKVNVLRSVAVALGLSGCAIAQAQTSYVAPAHWNNFKAPVTQVAAQDDLPAPPAPPAPADPVPADPIPQPESVMDNAYSQAMDEPWEGQSARLPLAPYFGGVNLLYFDLVENSSREIATGLNGFTSSAVEPDSSVGFDITAGKYLNCGCMGLGITYMLWNPDTVTETRAGAAGTIRAAMPAYNFVTIDPDGAGGLTAGLVYEIIDGTDAGYAGATAARVTRDVSFQGLEANLYCFGLMGACRVSYDNCCPPKHGICNMLGLGNRGCYGYGGATGPLRRGCGGRVRIMTSHGFRWMQVSDDLELAYNIDGGAGYQASDIYESVDVENNLFGYQFGGRMTYCLTCRLSMNIGAKFGIYGNHAEKNHRLGSGAALAYRNGVPLDVISGSDSDTVLSTLGELDLGLGYRIGCAWTVRGGYRLMGITGVATAWDNLPNAYTSVAAASAVHADDSYLLHGGYAGLEYNW